MRLKSLRIKGFKSFANDTTISFDHSLIGVVGPNGAGKSNIVDAIRWVLGESKSRELRLESMGDVIFNGTKKRKKGSVAQVTLEFENTKNLIPIDYNTVSISRLLYRSGESEYRLNNVTCRKRDITDLFLNSGIGSNSYAIIALGMVDDMLQNKDHSRRKMFEQAAGISKFKIRKKETESKLRSTEGDLERLEDILFELEANMKSLEKQAARAEKFLEIKSTYKEKTLLYSKLQVSEIHEQFKAKKSHIEKTEESYTSKNADFHKLEADLEKFKKDNIEKELVVSAQQKELNILFDEIRRLENQKELNKEKVLFNSSNRESLEYSVKSRSDRKEELGLKLENQEKYLSEITTEKDQIKQVFGTVELEYKEIKEKFEAKREDLNRSQKRMMELEEQRNQLEKQIAIQQNNSTVAEQNQSLIQTNLDKSSEDLVLIESTLIKLKKEEEDIRETSHKLFKSVEDVKQEIVEREKKLEVQRIELANSKRKLDQLISQRDLLKSMIDSMEGFPDSIKFLKKKWNTQLEMLADVIDCDEKYKQCVAQFFEPYLNHFVVSDVKSGMEGISTLRSSQKGKASFYILDDIPNIESRLRQVPSDWTQLSDVIKVKDQFRDLINYVCRNCYIVDDESTISEKHVGVTLISLNGSFIKKGAEIKGGSIGLFEGKKLGRKKSLEKILKEIEKTLEEVKNLETNLENLKAVDLKTKLQEKEEAFRSIQSELNDKRNERIKSETEFSLKKERLQTVERDFQRYVQEKSAADEKIEKLAVKLKEILNQQAESDDNPQDKENVLSELEVDLSRKSERYNEVQISLIKADGKFSAAVTELDFTKGQITENNSFLQTDSNKLDEAIRIIGDANEVISKLEIDLESKYTTKDEKQKTLNIEEQSYYHIKNEIGEKEKVIRELSREIQQLQSKINQMRERFHSLELEMNSISERLKIEFELELSQLDELEITFDEEIDLKELREFVEKLRRKISNYGEVNTMAVVTFNEIKERYDEMIVQRADIFTAKESLLETIAEIETEAVQKFSEAFDKISENFHKVFRSLFSEDDDCDLVLLNPDDPLESDIEIIAKPKGKRPKSLSQLSGGEKTLTATALLFSLYLLKPAPFCIFDEVDAPLDDANVLKFTKLINTFSKESQFILITHNKATMAAVDVLYGVYMQEQGVSGIAPVDFRQYEYNPILQVVED